MEANITCECVLSELDPVCKESLGKLLIELTVALRSTNASDRTRRLIEILEKISFALKEPNVRSHAHETYVALIPGLLQLRSFLINSQKDPLFIQILTYWLLVTTRLLTVFMNSPDPSHHHIQYIEDRLFELSSSDQDSSLRAIIVSALISDKSDCDFITAVISHLEILAQLSNNNPTVSYIETVMSVLLVLPQFIQSACRKSTLGLIQFSTNHSPLMDINLFQKFLFSKLVFLKSHEPTTESIRDTLLQAPSFSDDLRHLMVKYIHKQIIGERTNHSEEKISSEPSSPKMSVPKLSLMVENLAHSSPLLDNTSVAPKHRSKIIQIVLKCLFSKNRKNLFSEFSDEFPLINKRIPIMFHLFQFLSHPSIDWRDLVPIESDHPIIHRLLSNRRIASVHDMEQMIGSGQFGSVFVDSTTGHAIKLIQVPRSVADRCTIIDAYNEILAMKECRKDSFCLELLDFGMYLDGGNNLLNFFLESERYDSSLSKYRLCLMQRETGRMNPLHTVLLLIIFSEILAGVESLHKDAKIIHYDLKMDNILVAYGDQNRSGDEMIKGLIIPRIAIADFGEARVVEDGVNCVRNRGTECIKSPELLSMATKMRKDGIGFDRRRSVNSTFATDIWSLGCLFYELMTGQYLFRNVDGNWVDFYYRVTGENGMTETDMIPVYAEEELGDLRFVEFLRFLLVRDPDRRPSIDGAIKRFQKLYSSYIVDPRIFPRGTRIELPPAIPGPLKVSSV